MITLPGMAQACASHDAADPANDLEFCLPRPVGALDKRAAMIELPGRKGGWMSAPAAIDVLLEDARRGMDRVQPANLASELTAGALVGTRDPPTSGDATVTYLEP